MQEVYQSLQQFTAGFEVISNSGAGVYKSVEGYGEAVRLRHDAAATELFEWGGVATATSYGNRILYVLTMLCCVEDCCDLLFGSKS